MSPRRGIYEIGVYGVLITVVSDLVCIGAVITIMSVFFSALTQNILTTIVSYNDGFFEPPTAGGLMAFQAYTGVNGTDPLAEFASAQSILQAEMAIYTGALVSSVASLPVSCLTGNCSRYNVPTLGVCRKCIDDTSFLQKTCNESDCTFTVPGGGNIVVPSNFSSWTEESPVFTSSNGSDAAFQQSKLDAGEDNPWSRDDNDADATTMPGVPIMSLDFIGFTYAVWMEAMRNASSMVDDAADIALSNLQATECCFWFCVKALLLRVTNGTVHEASLWIYDNAEFVQGSGAGDEGHYVFTDATSDYSSNGSISYTVGAGALDGVKDSMYRLLTGKVIAGSDRTPTGTIRVTEALWLAFDNLDNRMSNISMSLTNMLRQAGTVTTNYAYEGQMSSPVAYVVVRWAWLAFPAALVLLSILFLAATIIKTSRSSAELRKNSALAALQTVVEKEGPREEACRL
ncbi:hypothetical protein LTR85_003609 [Meristemomyces frigidus]|nr:hypothetical protein LTR85_003609 [Meristemomyces frigidus]